MSNNHYEPEFKEKVLRLYLEEGRTKKSLTEEYNLGKGTLTYWIQQRHKECHSNPVIQEENDSYKEINPLRKELSYRSWKRIQNQLIDETLEAFEITRSLSHKGCPYNNAVAEATFKIIKTEFVKNQTFTNLVDLKLQISDYVD